MTALFRHGRQVSRAHASPIATAVEAFERRIVVTDGRWRPYLAWGWEIREVADV